MKFRRLIILMLALCLLTSLVSCSKETGKNQKNQESKSKEQTDLSILDPEDKLVKAWGYFTDEQCSEFIRTNILLAFMYIF